MKKDYLPVPNHTLDKEIDFVENYWTKHWQQSAFLPDQMAKIPFTQEYKAMRPFLNLFPKKAKILDGGCGLGVWTRYFNSLGYHTTGIDISRETIARLNRQYPKDKFIFGDIRKTKFKSSSFDVYFSWGTFEHFESGLRDCFQEADRLLKPNGLLFITIPYQNLRHIIKSFFPQKLAESAARFYQWRLTKQEIIQEMQLNRFKVLAVKPIHQFYGLRQFVSHDLGVPSQSIFHRPLQLLFYPLLPQFFVSHMLMAVGRKIK